MKAAVITPYYKEDIAILRRCHLSVLDQEVPCRHFMVADGFPNEIVAGWDCEHIALSKSHGDYGNTPRGIGALSAINLNYNPIFFLDADNWYAPQHAHLAIKLKEEQPEIDIAASMRTLALSDGMLVEPDQEDIQKRHVDTSCMAFFESSFFLLAMWCTMTKPLAVIGDRIMFSAINKHQLKVGWTGSRTLYYSTNYRHHYLRAGRTPPEQTYLLDTKKLKNYNPEQMWAWSRMRVDINNTVSQLNPSNNKKSKIQQYSSSFPSRLSTPTQDLTKLANQHLSDKGNTYKCAHFYTYHYQPIFEELAANDKSVTLLEIGLNRDNTKDVPSLRIYREFFGPKAKIHGMDINPDFSRFNSEGFVIFIGNQGNPDDLSQCAKSLYSIIIDDGSHASSHQQITLKELWKAVKPGGYYIIENLHWQPFNEDCITTRSLCEEWMTGRPKSSKYISEDWAKKFIEESSSMVLLPSFSKLYSKDLISKALFIARKKVVTSWDCFDTLITRRRLTPHSIFDEIERMCDLKNFSQRRKAAEARKPWSLDSIYDELAKDYKWSDHQRDHYKEKEITTEIEHTIPVTQNINQVCDGDLVVSDMYLPDWAIHKLLTKAGLDKNIKIYVTSNGKHSGSIWNKLPHFDRHIGDNYHSDVISPQRHGIHGIHYDSTKFTDHEDEIAGDLALLMRAVRLANPYKRGTILYSMWLEQSQLNIPALLLAALEIPASNVAFVMRDCIHLQPIHEELFKNKNTSFHCSRLAFKQGGEEFKLYATECAFGRTIVDLHGTGSSITNYWLSVFGANPDLIYITGTLLGGRLLVPCKHDALERFNSSPLGSITNFPNRNPCEFDQSILECQANARNCAISHLPYFRFQRNIAQLSSLVNKMPLTVTATKNIHLASHGQSR